MSKERDVSLSAYGISKYKYRELKNFCLQYREKQRQKGSRAKQAEEDICLIEQTAAETSASLCSYIIANVADGIPYENMNNPPCGRRQFYELRRKFFYLLSQKK